MAVMTNTRLTETTMSAAAAVPANPALGAPMKPSISPGGITPSHHHPGIGMKPGTQTPPANVLQVVKQVQEEAARQQAPHVGYGKVNPAVAAAQPTGVMPPPQMQRPMQMQMTNPAGTHLISMDQWQSK